MASPWRHPWQVVRRHTWPDATPPEVVCSHRWWLSVTLCSLRHRSNDQVWWDYRRTPGADWLAETRRFGGGHG